MQKRNKQMNKGITLIALIITIIVMLILVGVTVSVALNGGLFSIAKEAAVKTQGAIDEELAYLNMDYIEGYRYYSSIELAIKDANNLTTENSDLKNIDDATIAVAIKDDNVYIKLLKPISNVSTITLTKDTAIDLNSQSIKFSDAQYLTSNNNLLLKNGTMISNNSNYVIQDCESNSDAVLNIDSVNIINSADENCTTKVFGIYSRAGNKSITNTNINIENKAATNTNGLVLQNSNANNYINNITIKATGVGQVYGMQNNGNTTIDNANINAEGTGNDTSKIATGISNSTGELIINNITLNVKSVGGPSVSLDNRNICIIYGGTFMADSKNYESSYGIQNVGNLEINEKSKVTVEGLHSGLVSFEGKTLKINGGTYKSPIHGGLYVATGSNGSTEINNVNCINTEQSPIFSYNEHSTTIKGYILGHLGASYFGASKSKTDTWEVTIHNSIFTNSSKSNSSASSGICLKTSDEYLPPTLNLYDCKVYGDYYAVRLDTGAVLNIYGTTTLDYDISEGGLGLGIKSGPGKLNDYR